MSVDFQFDSDALMAEFRREDGPRPGYVDVFRRECAAAVLSGDWASSEVARHVRTVLCDRCVDPGWLGMAARLLAECRDGFPPFEELRSHRGWTVVHWFACYGEISRLPAHLRTPEAMGLRDADGKTPLHTASIQRQLGRVPVELLTPETLGRRDVAGYSVCHYDIVFGGRLASMGLLTPELLAERNDSGLTVLHLAVYDTGKWPLLSSSLITEELVAQRDLHGATVLHEAAGRGCLEAVPSGLLTVEAINRRTDLGRSVLHFAADADKLHRFPSRLITPETIAVQANDLSTPLHSIFRCNRGTLIPSGVLTEGMLLLQDASGNTPLHCCFSEANLRAGIAGLPCDLLTESVLSVANREGVTPRDLLQRAGLSPELVACSFPS